MVNKQNAASSAPCAMERLPLLAVSWLVDGLVARLELPVVLFGALDRSCFCLLLNQCGGTETMQAM